MIEQIEQEVEKHYGDPSVDLEEKIIQALRKEGKDINHLVWTDLNGLDEFHLRKREATVEMASLLNLQPETRVLDAGSGLGGPSRYLASEYGCHINGIDLSGVFCDVARSFARRFGFEDRLSYQQGSVLDLPFADDSFDVTWTQHVSMNIENKAGFFTELARVLKPNGMLGPVTTLLPVLVNPSTFLFPGRRRKKSVSLPVLKSRSKRSLTPGWIFYRGMTKVRKHCRGLK